MVRIIFTISLWMLSNLAFASVINHNELILDTKDQQWFILHNDTDQTVWLNAVINNPSASAGWGSKLDPNMYSLLALNAKQLQFTCGLLLQLKFAVVPCQRYLDVSQILSTSENKPVVGSYWVVENTSLNSLREQAAERGILLNFQ